MQPMKWVAASTVAFLIIVMFCFLEKNHVLIAERDEKNRMVASIVWKRSFPYLGLEADLIVEDFDGKQLLHLNLLKGRDAVEDISMKFPEISFRDGIVHLNSLKNHYDGPGSFNVSFRK